MTTHSNKILTIVGVALVLCLPVFGGAAALTAYLMPRQYYSKVVAEVRPLAEADLAQAIQTVAPTVKGTPGNAAANIN